MDAVHLHLAVLNAYPQNGEFVYKMVPVGNYLSTAPVLRREKLRDGFEEFGIPDQSDFKIHLYPFDTMSLRSHVHPRYAIYRAGWTLTERASQKDAKAFSETYPELDRKIRTIFATWTRPIPPDAEEDPQFRPPTPEPSEPSSRDSLYQTASHRLGRMAFKRPSLSVLFSFESDDDSDNWRECSSVANTMDWAYEDNPYRNPYWRETEPRSEYSESLEEDEPEATPPRSDVAVLVTERTHQVEGVEGDDRGSEADSNADEPLTRKALLLFDRAQDSSERWDKDGIVRWFKEVASCPSLKRQRTHP
jgi:hypothetical protein